MNQSEILLIIDQDREFCELLAAFLEKQGFKVVSAVDEQEALKQLETLTPGLIIAHIDVRNKLELQQCKHIRAITESLFIILANELNLEAQIHCLEIGIDDYIIKPFKPNFLLNIIKSLLAEKKLTSKTNYKSLIEYNVSEYQFGEWRFKPGNRTLISDDDTNVYLSDIEHGLLLVFLQHPHVPLTIDKLYNLINVCPIEKDLATHTLRLQNKLSGHGSSQIISEIAPSCYVFNCAIKRLWNQKSPLHPLFNG